MRRFEVLVWLVCLGGTLLGYVTLAIVASVGQYAGLSEWGAGAVAFVIGLLTMRIMVLAGTPGVFADIVPTTGPEKEKSLPARAHDLADAILHHR